MNKEIKEENQKWEKDKKKRTKEAIKVLKDKIKVLNKQLTYKEISEEIDKIEIVDAKVDEENNALVCSCKMEAIKSFLKAKLTQIIDEMVGEEVKYKCYTSEGEAEINGYNQKVQELKEFKEKFLTL